MASTAKFIEEVQESGTALAACTARKVATALAAQVPAGEMFSGVTDDGGAAIEIDCGPRTLQIGISPKGNIYFHATSAAERWAGAVLSVNAVPGLVEWLNVGGPLPQNELVVAKKSCTG